MENEKAAAAVAAPELTEEQRKEFERLEALRKAEEERARLREERRQELAAKARQAEKLQEQVRVIVAERAEHDEYPKRFQVEFDRRRRDINERLNAARSAAQDANSAREALVREFVPEEVRRRRGQAESAVNVAKIALRPIAEDVQALAVQLKGYDKKGGDAHGRQRLESRLAAREIDASAAQKKIDEAQADLDHAEAEFQAALAAALA